MKKKLKITVLLDDLTVPEESPDFSDSNVEHSTEYHVVNTLRDMGHQIRTCPVGNRVRDIIEELSDNRPDLVFNLAEQFAHNRQMDGNIAGLLELMSIPFTGTGSLGLMLSRNKGLCKRLLGARKVRVPGFIVVRPGHKSPIPKALRFPMVVKPNSEDGSDGIANSSLVKDGKELMERARMVHERFRQPAIAEEYIEGREIYAGVIGNGRLTVLPPREIFFPPADVGGPVLATQRVKFDHEYQKKWKIKFGFADLDEKMLGKVERVCKQAYRVLQMHDYGRLDIRITPEDNIYILEANPNPDIAYGEEVAESAERAGISYETLLRRIVGLAVQRSKT